MTKLVRIDLETYKRLDQLAQELGLSKQRVLDQAIKKMMREQLFKEANKAYEALQGNAEAFQEELGEQALWDTTLTDGLDND